MAAIIKYKNGKHEFVPHPEGVKAWSYLVGDKPTPVRKRKFVASIDDVILDSTKAPPSYYREKRELLNSLPDSRPYVKPLGPIGSETYDDRYR